MEGVGRVRRIGEGRNAECVERVWGGGQVEGAVGLIVNYI